MKELNISYHLDGYSALVNNCMDYNIAEATKGREGGSKGVSGTTAANFSSASS